MKKVFLLLLVAFLTVSLFAVDSGSLIVSLDLSTEAATHLGVGISDTITIAELASGQQETSNDSINRNFAKNTGADGGYMYSTKIWWNVSNTVAQTITVSIASDGWITDSASNTIKTTGEFGAIDTESMNTTHETGGALFNADESVASTATLTLSTTPLRAYGLMPFNIYVTQDAINNAETSGTVGTYSATLTVTYTTGA